MGAESLGGRNVGAACGYRNGKASLGGRRESVIHRSGDISGFGVEQGTTCSPRIKSLEQRILKR